MKGYSFKVRSLREADAKIEKFVESPEALLSSEEFKEFRGYIEDIARYKKVNGRKYARSTEYAAIGIMTINDLYQEAYLAFLEAYESYKEKKEDFEGGATIWAYLKKSTILNFEYALRNKKDGIRITQYGTFKNDGLNVNVLTTIFGKLEETFSKNADEVAMTKWETDLVGAFMDVHMDDYLDLTRTGKRDLFKKEREIIRSLYGLNGPALTYKEISEKLEVSQSTIRSVKERAIKRLKSPESKVKIADFLREYRITTNADYENI